MRRGLLLNRLPSGTIRKHFTPNHMVREMCFQAEPDILNVDKKIFEPCCGEGVFLLEIMDIRFKALRKDLKTKNKLVIVRSAVDLIKNIYAFDIVPEFILRSQSELLSKTLCLVKSEVFTAKEMENLKELLADIIQKNIQCADALDEKQYENIQIYDWSWRTPTKLNYVIFTMQDIFITAEGNSIPKHKNTGTINLKEKLHA